MTTTSDPWFVTERSEALARVWLTNRPDVRVRSERRLDDRLLLYVEIGTGDPLSAQHFVVQVKGTLSVDPTVWMENVKQLFPGPGTPVYLPACMFVVNVRENTAWYAWVAEPQAGENSRTLHIPSPPAFHPLDAAAIDGIVDRVKAYYQALSKQLVPA